MEVKVAVRLGGEEQDDRFKKTQNNW